MLSVPVVPGGHPLRALATADGAVPSLGPAWAEIGRAADPACARTCAVGAAYQKWQWTALPADYAGIVAASGLLRQSTRLVTMGGAYVESLRGRCAAKPAPPSAVTSACRADDFKRGCMLPSQHAIGGASFRESAWRWCVPKTNPTSSAACMLHSRAQPPHAVACWQPAQPWRRSRRTTPCARSCCASARRLARP